MDIQLIARGPHALQQPVSVDAILAMCVRVCVHSVRRP